MSYIVPNSTIKVFRRSNTGPIPFDVNYENTCYFPNAAAQESYMNAFNPIIIDANSYQRVNSGVIKISTGINDNNIDALYNANYMAFKNTSFENKWFYCFVDRTEYLNNNTVTMWYHLDVIQTYMFDWRLNQCLIEREHTVTDRFGEHTLPEGLETGPYRSIPAAVYLQVPDAPDGEVYMFNRFEYQRAIILATTLDVNEMITGNEEYSYGVIVPGAAGVGGGGEYYSGVRYTAFRLNSEASQGIYRITFSGNFVAGDRILVDDVMTTLTAAQVTNAASVAAAVATNVTSNSEHYFATHAQSGYAFIDLYERPAWLGYGYPNVQSNSVQGAFYVEVITPGSSGELEEVHKLNQFLQQATTKAKSDAIIGLFMMPYEFYPKTDDELNNGVAPLNMRVAFPTFIGSPLASDGYVPRNKKLFCSPYNEMYVTNNTGNEAQYRFEDFSNPHVRDSCMFSIWGNLSMNPGMYCAPMFYNGNGYMAGAIDDELIVTGFPMCSYAIDSYKAWLAQNAGMIGATAGSLVAGWATFIGSAVATGGTNVAFQGANIGAGVPTGQLQLPGTVDARANTGHSFSNAQPATPGMGLIGGTLGALGTLYDHSRRPPQSHGANNGNLAYQAGQLTFSWYYKQIKPEYAKIIDKFFDMYGYKTNRVGVPNLAARPKYTYVKTIGCSIDGMIPGDYKSQIEAIFDKGIRFWESNAVFGVYDPDVNDNSPAT